MKRAELFLLMSFISTIAALLYYTFQVCKYKHSGVSGNCYVTVSTASGALIRQNILVQ